VAEQNQVPAAMFQHLVESLPRGVEAVIAALIAPINALRGQTLGDEKQATGSEYLINNRHETKHRERLNRRNIMMLILTRGSN
jgi:hypothetical protein